MFKAIKSIFGFGHSINYKEVISNGGIIVDVRTQHEFAVGSIKGSINIPLDILQNGIKKLPKNKTIVTCCASGIRSSSAKRFLKSSGFEDVHNGGSWYSLQQKIQ